MARENRFRTPVLSEQQLLDGVIVKLIAAEDTQERGRYRELMEKHHYLKSDILVGEQLRYVAEVNGQWVALVSWSAAANHLKDREQWLGWSITQRRRRLALVANNARYLILPEVDCPNLASRVLALCCERLAADWEQIYGHPVLVVESFVDSQLFRGTCYKAQGWELLGQTKGCSRSRQDYYTAHDRPKQLWVRELRPKARTVLSAERLPGEHPACRGRTKGATCQRPEPALRSRVGNRGRRTPPRTNAPPSICRQLRALPP